MNPQKPYTTNALSAQSASLNRFCAAFINVTNLSDFPSPVTAHSWMLLHLHCSMPAASCACRKGIIHTAALKSDGSAAFRWVPSPSCCGQMQRRDSGCAIGTCRLTAENLKGVSFVPSALSWQDSAMFQRWNVQMHVDRQEPWELAPEESQYMLTEAIQHSSDKSVVSYIYVSLLLYLLLIMLASIQHSRKVSQEEVDSSKDLLCAREGPSPAEISKAAFRMKLYPSGCCAGDKGLLDEQELDKLHLNKSIHLDLFSDIAWME